MIELLVVITIVGVLCSLAFAGYGAAQRQARKSTEIGGAKQLVAAYLAFPLDHGGALMLGFDKQGGATDAEGQSVQAAAAHRYPYRLAPYFNYNMDSTVLTSRNRGQIDTADTYSVSLFPAMGINSLYVGGHREDSTVAMPSEVVATIEQASRSLLVFASAHYDRGDDDKVEGFHVVEPPRRESIYWVSQATSEDSDADDYGYVDPRHGGKAVAAFMDGAVRLHSIDELRDMRLWNQNAAAGNNPDYLVRRSGSTGRGGSGR